MEHIINKFIDYAKLSAKAPFSPPDIAMLAIDECKKNSIPIYGIDAVKITDTSIQPFMEHSIDYTACPYPDRYFDNVWDEAIQFIKSKEHLGLHFEIVIPEKQRDDMLTFELDAKEKLAMSVFVKMGTYDIMQDERNFKIYIDGRLFYHNEYFSILEFCTYVVKWLKREERWLKRKKNDFAYNTMGTEENPHIAFRIVEGGWKMESVWQQFDCEKTFSDEEVKTFINKIICHVTE